MDKSGSNASYIEGDVFNRSHPDAFINKHSASILAVYAINNKKEYIKEMNKFRIMCGLFLYSTLIFVLSIFFIRMEPKTDLYVSSSDNDHTFIRMMTMPWPVMTPPTIERWASSAIVNIMSVSFTNFDDHMKKIRPYFSEDGYEGIVSAFNKGYRAQIVNEHENMTTAPLGPSRMIHFPNKVEKWFTVEIPIISTFDNGNEQKATSRSGVATIIIGPAAGNSAEFGKVIKKIIIE